MQRHPRLVRPAEPGDEIGDAHRLPGLETAVRGNPDQAGRGTRPLVGSLYTDSFGYGRFEATGTLEAYFETNDLYQRVLDHGSGVLSFNIGNAANQKYALLLPKIIFGNGERRPGGNTDDVMVSIPFRAVYDQTTDATLQITRGVA